METKTLRPLDRTMLEDSQDNYRELLSEYTSLMRDPELSMSQIAPFLDEIKLFWMKKVDAIEFELDALTRAHQSFLLSGAIYLNSEDKEHYYFKTLGDYHVLFDPLLKMEGYFRIDPDKVDSKWVIEYIRDVFEDTLKVLREHPGKFLFLPIREIVSKNKKEHYNLLETFYWGFVSGIFSDKFQKKEEFLSRFKTYKDIESHIDGFAERNLVFTDLADTKLSLEDRIKRYSQEQTQFALITKGMTEPEVFLTLIYSHITQIGDIILTCFVTGLIPFIRSEVTFSFLLLIMRAFIDDSRLRDMLEKTVIFYVARKTIRLEIFEKMDFDSYCKKAADAKLLDRIISRIRERGINVFEAGPMDTAKIIQEEFSSLFAT